MTNDQSEPARPELTEQQREIQEQAKRLAKEKGLDWRTMSIDERKELRRNVRQRMPSKRV